MKKALEQKPPSIYTNFFVPGQYSRLQRPVLHNGAPESPQIHTPNKVRHSPYPEISGWDSRRGGRTAWQPLHFGVIAEGMEFGLSSTYYNSHSFVRAAALCTSSE